MSVEHHQTPFDAEPTHHYFSPEFEQALGELEHALLEKLVLKDIEPEKEEQKYHLEMVSHFLRVESSEVTSFAARMLIESGKTPEEISEISIEQFSAEDLGFGYGSKRNVDLMTIRFSDGTEQQATMSLDREWASQPELSASLAEGKLLSSPEAQSVESIQRCYGFREMKAEQGVRGVICKEFVQGAMLEDTERTPEIAYAVGKAVGEILQKLKGIPMDSTPMNIIIGEQVQGGVQARYCDVEAVRTDAVGIDFERNFIAYELGDFKANFERGITDGMSSAT